MFIEKAKPRYIFTGKFGKGKLRLIYDIYACEKCARCKCEYNEHKVAKHKKQQEVNQRWGHQ